jgi:hypothetical protein
MACLEATAVPHYPLLEQISTDLVSIATQTSLVLVFSHYSIHDLPLSHYRLCSPGLHQDSSGANVSQSFWLRSWIKLTSFVGNCIGPQLHSFDAGVPLAFTQRETWELIERPYYG